MANRRFIDFPVATTVGANDIILIWQDGLNKQTTKATILSGLPSDLEDLADVNISGLTNGQILRYDSTTGKWVNTDQGNLDLDDLNDVSIVSPSNGQVLVYNSSTSRWENSSGGFVPYVGAVTTVDLGAQGLRAGYVRFNTSVVSVPDEQGIMYWDADNETVDVILNGTIMQIGQDLFYPVKNQTGSTIPKGTAVRFAGTVGASGRLLIAPFIANNSVPSSRFMGVTSEAILNGADGKVMWFGRIRGINTNAFNEGDILYASTTTAGGFQTTIPVAPNNIVQVAAVVTKSINNGAIFVRPTIGSNINKDEGVKITSVANLDLLQYQSGTALWENKAVATVMSNYVTLDGTQTISGAKTFTTATKFDAYIRLKHDIYLEHISGYSTIGSDANNFFLAASSSKYAVLNVGNLTSQQTYTFPNASGTIALVGGAGVGTVTSVAALTLGTSGTDLSSTVANSTTTPVITLNVPTASATNRGALSAADWTTFNNKQNALTNPVTGTGTTNYLPKFTGTSTIGNSQVFDDGTNVGIGITAQSDAKLYVQGALNIPAARLLRQGSYGTVIEIGRQGISIGASIGYPTDDTFSILTGGSERARITSGGNLLVGRTTDNGARLQVNGGAFFTAATETLGSIRTTFASDNSYFSLFSNDGPLTLDTYGVGAFINFKILGSTRLSIANTGAATFSSSVTAAGNAATNPSFIANNPSGSSGTAQHYIDFTAGATVLGRILRGNGASGLVANGLNIDNFDGCQIRLNQLGGSGGSFNVLGGNVGINTASPQTTLDVNGAIATGAPLQTHQSSRGVLEYNGNKVALRAYGGTSGSGFLAFNVGGGGGSADSEAMRITSSGNVLIGTTTDNGARLQINGITSSAGYRQDTGAVTLGNNSATTIYSNSGIRGLYLVYVSLPAGDGAAANYTASAIIAFDTSASRIMQQTDGLNLFITLSGNNVQARQTSGGVQSIEFRIIKIV